MLFLFLLGALFVIAIINNTVKTITGFDAVGTWVSNDPKIFGYVLVAVIVIFILLYFKITRKK